jgi:hypothetical protein
MLSAPWLQATLVLHVPGGERYGMCAPRHFGECRAEPPPILIGDVSIPPVGPANMRKWPVIYVSSFDGTVGADVLLNSRDR